MSVSASNYILDQIDSTLSQLDSSRAAAADLTSTSRAVERAVSSGIVSQIKTLFASDPSLANTSIALSDTPTLQFLDTRGEELYRVLLPTRVALRAAYYYFLTGQPYSPVTTADANAYYTAVQAALAARTVDDSNDFFIVGQIAAYLEAPMRDLLLTLRITDPVVTEWFMTLAYEAGDGDDRSRELLGYALTSHVMAGETDDYSAPGLSLTSDRITLRNQPNSFAATEANAYVDLITGNIDQTGLTPCPVTLSSDDIAANKAAVAAIIRITPALATPGGVTAALATVNAKVTDLDTLAETTAELINRGTASDPILAALTTAANYLNTNVGITNALPPLMAIDTAANTFTSTVESAFGAQASPLARIAISTAFTVNLTGYRRKEAIEMLGLALIPAIAVNSAAEVLSLLRMLSTQTTENNAYTNSIFSLYLSTLPDQVWPLRAFFSTEFIDPTTIALATTAALAAITADLTQPTTQLTSADTATFSDAVATFNRLTTPEDLDVQRERLRDISQRFSNIADTATFRYYLEIVLGGTYLDPSEYAPLAASLAPLAVNAFGAGRPAMQIIDELNALGKTDVYSSTYLASLAIEIESLQSGLVASDFTPLLASTNVALNAGIGGQLSNKYLASVLGTDGMLVLQTAIRLSRALNAPSGSDAQEQLNAAQMALQRIFDTVSNPTLATELFNALTSQVKPAYVVSQESALAATITKGNQSVITAYTAIATAVSSASTTLINALPTPHDPVSLGTVQNVLNYPLSLYARNNEYASGITSVAANLAVQGVRVLPTVGTSLTVYQSATPSSSTSAYTTSYSHVGADVTTSTIYDSSLYTYSGENPVTSFSSGILTSSAPIQNYTASLLNTNSVNSLTSSLMSTVRGTAGVVTSALSNVLCLIIGLHNLQALLNGVINAVTGTIVGGINNAIGQLNSTISGLTGQLKSLLGCLSPLTAINMKISCMCISRDPSAALKKLIKPISSWLTSFGSGIGNTLNKLLNFAPFKGIKNPIHLNSNIGCSESMLSNLGKNPFSK